MTGPDANTHALANDNPSNDEDRTNPHPHDVLCGRGGQSNNHPGNEWFRRLVRSNRALYRSCPKHTKLLVAKAIVQAIQQQDPPGRFIKIKDSDNCMGPSEWAPIPYSQAVNKTSQALREKDSSEKPKALEQQYREKANERIATEARKKVQFEGMETAKGIANLTNATIQSAELSKAAGEPTQNQPVATTEDPKQKEQNSTTTKNRGRAGKKRKSVGAFVKPSWWGMESSTNPINTANNVASNSPSGSAGSGTVVTTDNGTTFNEDSNKRAKVTNGLGGLEIKNMGRGVVNQIKEPALSLETQADATTPMPIETSLESRQSSMFRFLSNTRIFGRLSSAVPPSPFVGTSNPNSSLATDTTPFDANDDVDADRTQIQNTDLSQNPTSWPQQTERDMISNLQYQQEQRNSTPSLSEQHMGRTSVQELRARQLIEQQSLLASGHDNGNKELTVVEGSEDELKEISTTGLMDSVDDFAPPPPLKAMKSQMSDWLTSFFPSSTKINESVDNSNHSNNDIFDSSSQDDIDDDEAAVPPPPGGGSGLGRGVSSAIFGLIESPSILLTTLKSGVSSVFGDSIFRQTSVDDMASTPIRRFPSSFQQQQMQKQQQQNILQQHYRGNVSAGGAMIGNQPVLGEKAKRGNSLLDDFDETPMEKELRNAKPEEKSRGPIYF